MIHTKEQNPNGLHQKYVIRKIIGIKKDSTLTKTKVVTKAVDPTAEYFVLRLDKGCKDINHRIACIKAVNTYADRIERTIPELAKDLKSKYPFIENEMNTSVKFNTELITTFHTFQEWVNKASSRIGGFKKEQRIICIDKNGDCLTCGKDFMDADEKGLFPVKAYRLIRTSERNG